MRILALLLLARFGSVAVAQPSSEPAAGGQQPPASDAKQAALAEQFSRLEREWMEALVRKDRATLERFLAPEYALRVADGPPDRLVGARQSWLETSMCCYDMTEFSQKNFHVRELGPELAVVSLIHTQKATVKPGPNVRAPVGAQPRDRSGDFFLVDIWKKAADGWKVAARHSAPLGAAAWTEGPGQQITRQGPPQSQAEAEVRALMQSQVDAWNRGDLDRFLEPYWDSPQLAFFSNGRVLRGRAEIAALMRERYKDGMGRLTFGEPHFELLRPDAAVAWGEWTVQLSNGQERRGVGTAVFRNLGGQWRIVHDHSSAMPAASPQPGGR